uniref:Chaperone DnaJ-domain superfamily protein n=1 Tax=Mangifera indica TaxID=29780 RepID=A0A097BU25_MANIN|nr:chaperone DnaJ-domain superfamily protein [Mangifera indica]
MYLVKRKVREFGRGFFFFFGKRGPCVGTREIWPLRPGVYLQAKFLDESIMDAPLNTPLIPPFFFLPPSPRKIGLSPNSAPGPRRNKRNPSPFAVLFTAEGFAAVGTVGGSLYGVFRGEPTGALRENKTGYCPPGKIYPPDLLGEGPADGPDFIEIPKGYAPLLEPAGRAGYDLFLAGRSRGTKKGLFGFLGGGGFYPS